MSLFSILWSTAVFWNIWTLDLTTCNFTSILVNYHTFFLVRFSFCVLDLSILQTCPAHSSLMILICDTTFISLHKHIFIVVYSPLCILLHWTTYFSKSFLLKGHFHVTGHSPNFTCIACDASDYGFIVVFL
jgi:hypothetical protein